MTLYKFTPDIMDKEVLERLTVGRDQLLQEILNKIKEHAMKKIPFYLLLIGPRGIGKSHLLLLIYYKIMDTPDLLNRIEPVKFSEEEYSITKLSDLFYRILEEKGATNQRLGEESIIENATLYLNNLKKRKMPLLLMDNVHLVFSQMTDDDLKRLRSILQEQNNLIIIGSSPSIFGQIASYDQPFYNFFEIRFLTDLTDNEVEELVKKKLELEKKEDILREFEKYRPKIRAIAVLTGGNPRLVISLCDILCQPDTLIDIEKALLTLLDELTPFYQARMESLSTQQRKLFDVLSIADGPLTPTEIAKLSGYDVNVVNVQMKRMEESGFVEPLKFRRKKSVPYEVKERLFRIWREMRFPLGRKRISLFVNFLKIWYSKEELIEELQRMVKSFEEALRKGTHDTSKFVEHLLYIVEAMGTKKYRLLQLRFASYLINDNFVAAENELAALKRLGRKDKKARSVIYEAEALLYLGQREFKKAMKSAEEALNIEPEDPFAAWVMSNSLMRLGRFKEAIKYVDSIVENKDHDIRYIGLFDKSYILDKMGKHVEALNFIDKAILIDEKSSEAWTQKGNILLNLKNSESIQCYDRAIQLNPNYKEALRGHAFASIAFGKAEAEKWIDKGLSLEPDDLSLLLAKSFLLLKKRDIKGAVSIAKKTLEIGVEKGNLTLQSMSASLLLVSYTFESIRYLKDGGIENAKATFSDALQLKSCTEANKFKEWLLGYFINLFEEKHFDFILQAFNIARQKLDDEDRLTLIPLVKAAEYIMTGNVDIFEGFQKEIRQFIVSIIKKYSPETPIPKELEQT